MSARVLVAARSTLAHMVGGYQRITWDVCRGLARRGWDVTVLTTPVPGRPARFEMDGLPVATAQGARSERLDRHWRRHATPAARELGDFDVVLGAGPAGQAVRLPGAAEAFQCQDTFLHEVGVHGRDGRLRLPPGHWRPWVARYLAREMEYLARADAVLASGPGTAAALRRWPYRLVPNARDALVVRNGVDPGRHRPDPRAASAWRAAHGIPADAPLVLTVCRLARGKGVPDALQAFRAFHRRHPAAVHAVVGQGEREAEARGAASRLGLGAAVRFLGGLPDGEALRWMQAADLFLFLPWRAEVRPPLGIVEALACGADVVASQTALDPALPHPRLHPVPPRRPDEAAEVLERAWRTRLRRPRGADAPLPAELTLDACVQGHERLLRLAIERRSHAPPRRWPSARPAPRPREALAPGAGLHAIAAVEGRGPANGGPRPEGPEPVLAKALQRVR